MKKSFVQTAKSRRFCMECNKITTFILDEISNHSYCKYCEKARAIHPKNRINKHKVKKMGKGKNLPLYEPKTVMESIELLEDYLCAEIDNREKWDIKYLKEHFKICKKEVKKLMR